MKIWILFHKISLHWNSFPHPQQKPASRAEIWPPCSRDIHRVAYLGEVLTDPLTKKQSLITSIIEVFSNIPREATKRGCWWWFWPRLEEVIGTKGNLCDLYPTKQFRAVSLCCCSYLSGYHNFYFHLKTFVNTPRTLYFLSVSTPIMKSSRPTLLPLLWVEVQYFGLEHNCPFRTDGNVIYLLYCTYELRTSLCKLIIL